jgi:hypothetical protein
LYLGELALADIHFRTGPLFTGSDQAFVHFDLDPFIFAELDAEIRSAHRADRDRRFDLKFLFPL